MRKLYQIYVLLVFCGLSFLSPLASLRYTHTAQGDIFEI